MKEEAEAWQVKAACLDSGIEFFPKQGESVEPAKAVCRVCPVRSRCLDEGMSEYHGIWGGESERSRRKIRKRRNIKIEEDA